ncbi:unnamed protein product [Haemonchus placei]|uniref:Leishmanolysin-like peptidase n=1 Tax=Haemonchus placei TaxID=6290 RepID=A0A0N4WYR6_HAEPC|nr:unnamed protein product [Haemonchus placei]
MEWGKSLGCAFVTKSCLTWMKMNPTNPYPFCTVYEDARCTTTRLEKLKCTLGKTRNGTFPPGFSPEYDYNVGDLYRDNKGQFFNGCGLVTEADFCPYYMRWLPKTIYGWLRALCRVYKLDLLHD